jgi:hypothetical protein
MASIAVLENRTSVNGESFVIRIPAFGWVDRDTSLADFEATMSPLVGS